MRMDTAQATAAGAPHVPGALDWATALADRDCPRGAESRERRATVRAGGQPTALTVTDRSLSTV